MTAASPLLRRTGTLRDGRALLIRPAQGDDAEALVALRDEVAAEGRWIAAVPGERSPLEERLALASLHAGGGLALVAEVDGGVAGTVAVHRSPVRWKQHLGELSIAIAAPARGAGTGSALLATAIDWARAVRLGKLWLAVFDDNAAARALYDRHGFVEEGRQPDQLRLDGRPQTLVLMGLRLDPPA